MTREHMSAAVAAWVSLLVGCGGAPSTPTTSETEARAPIDAEAVARVAREEASGLVEAGATRATVVVLDPRDGRVLAAVGAGPEGDREAERIVEVGSTLKPLTVAAALDAGLDPNREFPGEGGRWQLDADTEVRDAHPREAMTARDVLVVSSNVGAAKIVQAVGERPIAELFDAVHAEVPATGSWPTHGAGIGVRMSALDLARAYGALANGGLRIDADGQTQRLFSNDATQRVLQMLEAAVGDEGTGHRARVRGERVGGKTGTTADGAAVFAGVAPLAAPRYVIVIRAEQPGGYGGSVAAPAFARVATALLAP